MPLRRIVFTPSFYRESFRRRATYTRPQQSFSPFRRECFYECSSSLSLSFQRERERERDHNIHSYIDLFCDLNAKALEFRESFSTNTGCFCPKKKRRTFLQIILLNNARKFSRVIKHSKRVSRTKANEKVFHERARDSLFVGVVLAFGRSVLVRKLFERDRVRERTKEFHSCRRQN